MNLFWDEGRDAHRNLIASRIPPGRIVGWRSLFLVFFIVYVFVLYVLLVRAVDFGWLVVVMLAVVVVVIAASLIELLELAFFC